MFHQALSTHQIALRRNSNNRTTNVLQFAGNELVARTNTLVSRQTEDDDINFRERLANHVIQAFAQKRSRTMISGGINQNQLALFTVDDATNIVTRRFRTTRCDRNLLADERVCQR